MAKEYRCKYCEKVYSKPSWVKQHEIRCDPNWKWDCNICGKVFASAVKLGGHKRACGKPKKPRTKRRRFANPDGHICKYCEKEFKSGQALGGHTIRCPENPNPAPPTRTSGWHHTPETKKRLRLTQIAHLEKRKGHQLKPNYNPDSIPVIEEYGKKHGYNFQHAENGGEYQLKELGYWVDAYDPDKNVVLEYDESHHFDSSGNLKQKDIERQREIEEYLGCEFIRIKQ